MTTRPAQEGLEVATQFPAHGHDHPIHLEGPVLASHGNSAHPNSDFSAPSAEKRQLPVISSEQPIGDVLPEATEPYNSTHQKRRSKGRWIIAAVVLIVIFAAVVGGTVGGILGAKKNKSSTTTPSPATTSIASTPTNVTRSLPTSNQASVCHGGICPATLSTISWPSKQFVFGLSETKSLVYKSRNGESWDTGWTDLGGSFGYAPAIVSWGEGRIDIMGVGIDRMMSWKSFQNNIWSDWISLGGLFTSAPTAACWAPKRIDLFGRGTDGALWHNYWGQGGVQSWATWESLGGVLLGAPSVATWGSLRLDIFVRGTDQALWHIWYDGSVFGGGWGTWESLSGILASDPIVVSSEANTLDIFGLGQQSNLCWKGFHNTWLGWQCLGDTLESLPAPVVLGSDRIDVFGLTTNDHVYHRSLVSSTWSSGWDDLGGPMNSAPVALNLSTGQAVVFGVAMNGQMFDSNWASAAFSWSTSPSWDSMGGNFSAARL